MRTYDVGGKTAATTATIDNCIANIWNPSTVRRLGIKEVHLFKQAAGGADEPVLRRSTARGTAGSTVTPTIRNDRDGDLAPVTAFLLDLAAFTVQPTSTAGEANLGALVGATIGSGLMWTFPDPIWVPAGAGFGIWTGVALAFPIARVTFVCVE